MSKNIYVGNLVWDASSDELLDLFGRFGAVEKAQVVTDRETGRSRGFGFVVMTNDDEAERAIQELNGHDHNGHNDHRGTARSMRACVCASHRRC